MKKTILSISLFCLIPLMLTAGEIFKFSFTPELGITNGTIHEYVFDEDCTNTNNKESQLDWDVKNIPYVELKASSQIYKYFFTSLTGRFSIPKKSGVMQDYDWLNYLYAPDADPTELTNYSIHNNHLDTMYGINYCAGGNIFLTNDFIISPYISYDYDYCFFSAFGGTGNYKYSIPQEQSWPDNSRVISYTQEINSFMLGLKIKAVVFEKLDFDTDFMLSPKLSFNNALDYHYVQKTYSGTLFWDDINNMLMIKTQTRINYRFNENHKAGLSLGFRYIPLSKGQDYTTPIDTEGNTTESYIVKEAGVSGGTKSFLWNVALSYSFSF